MYAVHHITLNIIHLLIYNNIIIIKTLLNYTKIIIL